MIRRFNVVRACAIAILIAPASFAADVEASGGAAAAVATAGDASINQAARSGEATLSSRPARAPVQGAPLLVTRNSIVSMEYVFGALTIRTEGRAMSQGRAGETVRIMNLESKSTVAATVVGPARVAVK